jgi:general stress protein YciG
MVLGGERVGVGVVAADPNGVVEVGREGGGAVSSMVVVG